jgi:hypothetical protein
MTTTTHDPIFLNDDSNTGTGPSLFKGEGKIPRKSILTLKTTARNT